MKKIQDTASLGVLTLLASLFLLAACQSSNADANKESLDSQSKKDAALKTCLESPKDWELIREKLDGEFELCNDIDFKGAQLNPIGSFQNPFTGSLNGNGHRLLNFEIEEFNGSRLGLFATISGKAEVKNLKIEQAKIRGAFMIGALAGEINGEARIQNIELKDIQIKALGDVNEARTAGLLAGLARGGNSDAPIVDNSQLSDKRVRIENIQVELNTNKLSESGFERNLGGLLGHSFAVVVKSIDVIGVNEGVLTEATPYQIVNLSGGIGLAEQSQISDVHVNMELVSSGIRQGGVVGYLRDSSSLEDCSFSGLSSGRGIFGGVVGHAFSGHISRCSASGELVSPRYAGIGGIVGWAVADSTVSDSYSTALVRHEEARNSTPVGGIVGWLSGSLHNSYSSGEIQVEFAANYDESEGNDLGRGVGRVSEGSVVEGNFVRSDLNPELDAVWAQTLSDEEFRDPVYFLDAGWSESIWNLVEGEYPELQL